MKHTTGSDRVPGLHSLPPESMSLSLAQVNHPKRALWWGRYWWSEQEEGPDFAQGISPWRFASAYLPTQFHTWAWQLVWEECCALIIAIKFQLFLAFFAAGASLLPSIPQADPSQLCSQHRKKQGHWKRLVWKVEGKRCSLPPSDAGSGRASGYRGKGSPYYPTPVIPQSGTRTEP